MEDDEVGGNYPIPYDPDVVARRVYHLRKGGMSFASIVDTLREDAVDIQVHEVISFFRKMSTRIAAVYGPEDRKHSMALEMERLDDLQGAVWNMALQGDFKAVDSVLKVMAQRAKLLGLDQLPTDTKDAVNTVLIVGGSQAEFLDALNHGRKKPELLAGTSQDDGEDDEQEDP